MMNLIKSLLLIFITIGMTACSTPIKIKLNAAEYLNRDDDHHSLPAEVVIYQLRDDQVFRQANFQELWQDDQNTLGNSLLERREINIAPGDKTKITLSRNKEMSFIGIIAIFREPENGQWRVIKKIGKGVPLTDKNITVFLKGNHLEMK